MSDTNALRQRIADEINRQPSDLIGSPSLSVGYVINREINSAIKHYESKRFRWNEKRDTTVATTVSGTRNYSLPADFIKMDTLKLVYSSSYISLKSRSWGEIDEQDRLATGSRGVPSVYAIHGTIVRLYPVPQGAYTLLASYINRFPLTSLTGSYCGSQTITPTTTASHNNRLNGWYIDGEELIRARAKAAVEINYLEDADAIAEMRMLKASRSPFLSITEELAFKQLADETSDALSTGKIRPYPI